MICPICNKYSNWFETHHKVLRSAGGTDELSNLQKMCKECHVSLHDTPWNFRKDHSNEKYYELMPSKKLKADYIKALEKLKEEL